MIRAESNLHRGPVGISSFPGEPSKYRKFPPSRTRESTSPFTFMRMIRSWLAMNGKGEYSNKKHQQPTFWFHGGVISNSHKQTRFRRGPCCGPCWPSIAYFLMRRDFEDTRHLPYAPRPPCFTIKAPLPSFLIHFSLSLKLLSVATELAKLLLLDLACYVPSMAGLLAVL